MLDAYSQAQRFYLFRLLRSWTLQVFTAMGLLMTVTAMANRNRLTGTSGFMLGGIFLSMTLWLMFREQVIGPRRRLFPNFVEAQVVAFAVSSAVVMTLLTAAVIGSGDESVIRAAAVVGFVFGGVGLLILTQSVVLIGVFFFLGYGPSVGLSGIVGAWITPGNAPAVLVVSALMVILAVFGFIRLTEESKWYRGPSGTSLFPRATGDGNQPWAVSDGRWRQLFRFRRTWPDDATATRWQRVRRWNSRNRFGWLLMAAWFGGISLYLRWPMLHQTSFGTPVRPQPDMSPLFLGIMVLNIWLFRWRYLDTELLRPVSRPAFFKQLGGAMAIDFAIAFAACVAIIAIPQFMVAPAHDAVYFVALQATAYAGIFVLCFGFTALLLRYRSRGMLMLNFLVLVPASLVPFLPIESMELGAMICFIAAVAAIALIGLALTMHAYRLWLDVELA